MLVRCFQWPASVFRTWQTDLSVSIWNNTTAVDRERVRTESRVDELRIPTRAPRDTRSLPSFPSSSLPLCLYVCMPSHAYPLGNKTGTTAMLRFRSFIPNEICTNRIPRKQGSCLEKEIMQGTMPGACRRGRPRTAWMDNIKTWVDRTLPGMTEDRDKWRKYVHGVTNPRIEDG